MYRRITLKVAPLAGALALIAGCTATPSIDVPQTARTAPQVAVPSVASESLHPVTTAAAEGWHDLFAADLSNADYNEDSWVMEAGVLSRQGRGNIWSREQYGDFILDLEFKLEDDTNSGVFIRTGSIRGYVQSSIEIQIHATTDGTPHGMAGAIYDCLSPTKMMTKPTGEWNRYTITAQGNRLIVVYNGEQIIDADLDQWTEPHLNPDGSRNKFNTPIKDLPRVGFIGLQDHGQPIWFRNMRIKSLTM